MAEECGAFGIKSARQKIERDAAAVFPQRVRIMQTGERMIIRDKVKRFALGLQRDRGPHHAEVISDVQDAARLDAG